MNHIQQVLELNMAPHQEQCEAGIDCNDLSDRSTRSTSSTEMASEEEEDQQKPTRPDKRTAEQCNRRHFSDSTCSSLSMTDPCLVHLENKRGLSKEKFLESLKKEKEVRKNMKFGLPKEISFPKMKGRKKFRELLEI